MRVRIAMVAVLAAALVACDGSAPVEVPNLVGLTLQEARERAGSFELEEVDASGQNRGVCPVPLTLDDAAEFQADEMVVATGWRPNRAGSSVSMASRNHAKR